MVRLREIPRTATFAWSPGSALPLIATGTRAGAVDADFSNETVLELWDLGFDQTTGSQELQPAAKIATDSGFHDIAWGRLHEDYPQGVIAGALENGSLDLWNAEKLLNGSSDSHMSRTSKHSGAVKTLQFNPFRSELLASAGAKGELFISDLHNISNPFRLGNTAARADDIECLDWNKKVPHIMVTGSSGGFVTVWDVKAKKESLTLNNLGRKAVSAVAWDPDKPTKLMTAIPLDTEPLILLWDLRNSNAPEKLLRGHDQGVLSLAWCPQDTDLLLSCGKDNRTICWNPQTTEAYGEFPVVTNWTFQTRWNPHNPNLFATASFDGKIAVQTIQSIRLDKSQDAADPAQALDGEDFFSKAQIQPQADTFSLPNPPKWMKPPVSVSFGFGGKIVSVIHNEGSRSSKIRISSFEVDSKVGSATEGFEEELKAGNFSKICESRIASATTDEEKADWKVIETLISTNPRKSLVEYLGFSDEADEAADELAKLGLSEEKSDTLAPPQVNGSAAKKTHNRLSSFFDNADGDSFLLDLAASKGAKTNNPFQIYTGSESESDRRITRSLILGQFEKALDICLEEDRMSDAFMVAICGGPKCIEKAQAAYFSKQTGGPNYLRLLASVVGKNLWDVVYNADLANWKEVMATLSTFADPKDYPDLCEALGDRLEELMRDKKDKDGLRKDASFCYLAGSKLEKVVAIWIEELQEKEAAGQADGAGDSSFSIHTQALQNFIEKVTIFREVTRFQDSDRQKRSDWKLVALYEKYIEYADVVAAHGQIKVAERYLDLLPSEYPLATMARNRVKQATRKAAAPTVVINQPAVTATAKTSSKPLPAIQGFQTQQSPARSQSYAPPSSTQPSNPYAPQSAVPYTNVGGYQPPQQMRQPVMVPPPPQQFGSSQHSQPVAPPPPRAYNQSPSIPPPSQSRDMPNWNDIPDNFAKPTSRRGTPGLGQQPLSSPFPNQPMQQQYQAAPPHQGAPHARQTPPVAPPPKGGAPPPRMSSPLAGGAPLERPSSSSSNMYAPPQSSMPQSQSMPAPMAPPIARGPSPYNAPPPGPPPSNRYAPTPAAQQSAPPPQPPSSIPPPPTASSFQSPPPINPYAPQTRQGSVPVSPYGLSSTPSHSLHQPMHQGPPQAAPQPPPQAPSQGPPSQGSRPGTATSQRRAPPAAPKYPPGDRTHIPSLAQPIFEILSADMARVKSRAPASFKAQVNDTEKRLNILYDHLNNEDLLKPDTVASMVELAGALQARNYDAAQAVHLDILTNKTEECGQWMVGVKRLIGMSRATP